MKGKTKAANFCLYACQASHLKELMLALKNRRMLEEGVVNMSITTICQNNDLTVEFGAKEPVQWGGEWKLCSSLMKG